MTSHKTFELKISFLNQDSETKELLMAWLNDNGIDSFVEGTVDHLDIDHEFGMQERDYYGEQGGNHAPILIYSFDEAYIADLAKKITADFPLEKVKVEQGSLDSQAWQTGWKDSFRPISTDLFYIYPPWNKPSAETGKVSVVIEPGMAFGTGQHATTQLCLRMIETLHKNGLDLSKTPVLDVGTGSGILAIALAKLGTKDLWATDIDRDALLSARGNVEANQVQLTLKEGSVPDLTFRHNKPFDLVIANILFVVLEKLIPDLAKATSEGGLVILSGLLVDDEEAMNTLAAREGLTLRRSLSQDDWLALLYEKKRAEKKS